jgi:hypothetical protein
MLAIPHAPLSFQVDVMGSEDHAREVMHDVDLDNDGVIRCVHGLGMV